MNAFKVEYITVDYSIRQMNGLFLRTVSAKLS
jgi:hypothetical protein